MFYAAEIAGVPDKEKGRLPEALKAYLESMLRGSVPARILILPGEEANGVKNLGGRESTVRSASGVLTLFHKESGLSKQDGSF